MDHIEDRKRVLGVLKVLLQNFLIGLASIHCIERLDEYAVLRDAHFKIGRRGRTLSLPLGGIVDVLEDERLRKKAIAEYLKMCMRSLLIDAHAAADKCHKKDGAWPLKKQPWWQFFRIMRNCMAHDATFDFNSWDRKNLPVTWNGLTIDISMNHTSPSLEWFGPPELTELLSQITAFARQSCRE